MQVSLNLEPASLPAKGPSTNVHPLFLTDNKAYQNTDQNQIKNIGNICIIYIVKF